MLSKFQPFFALQKLQHITRQDILGGNFDVLRKKEQIKGRILLKGKNVERMYSKQLKILRNISDFQNSQNSQPIKLLIYNMLSKIWQPLCIEDFRKNSCLDYSLGF